MTPQEGLAAIETLCDDTILHDHDGFGMVYVSRIRDVLADVDPEPAPEVEYVVRVGTQQYTRDQWAAVQRYLVDFVPAPASSTIDRDALHALIADAMGYETDSQMPNVFEVEDAVLALVQPAQGITLTAEESGWAADWHDYVADMGGDIPAAETEVALRLRVTAARLGGDA